MSDTNASLIFGFIQEDTWKNIDAVLAIFSILSISSITLYIFFKILNLIKIKWLTLIKGNYILVCGLNENSKYYINSEINAGNTNIIVIEWDKNNSYIDSYKTKKIAVKIADAKDENVLKSLKISKASHIVIFTDNDMLNLDIAIQVFSIVDNKQIYIHVKDRSLRYFHKEHGGIFKNSNIKIFSYYEDASRELFDKYEIYGNDEKFIDSSDEFSIVVIGNTSLAYEVIYQACIMGQLPNENKLTIHCIDKDVIKFKNDIELNYIEINNVPNINLEYIELDINTKEFYTHSLWQTNIKNIILCFENDQKNLDVAANLASITYIDEIAESKLKLKIIISMFNKYNLSEVVKKNDKLFANFYMFGSKNDIYDRRYLIDELRDEKAKIINSLYLMQNQNSGKEWEELSYFEKESNRASADHMKIKEKYFSINSNNEAKELLAKCEHNRWMAFHLLNGYKLGEKNHKKKIHNCLIPFDDLSNEYKDYDRKIIELVIKTKEGSKL